MTDVTTHSALSVVTGDDGEGVAERWRRRGGGKMFPVLT